jgi:hypothetical protein
VTILGGSYDSRTFANISCLRICLFPRYIQGLSGICIVRIEPQYFVQFQNSILPPVDPA